MSFGLTSINNTLTWSNHPEIELGKNQVLIEIAYAGLNRADYEQQLGNYGPPLGTTPVLGLECSGRIIKIGPETQTSFKIGDYVMALVTGGAFAETVIADIDCTFLLPSHLDLQTAAILPESIFTFWANVIISGGLKPNMAFLVQGGASGLGSFCIQIAKAMNCSVYSLARGEERVNFVKSLGADKIVNTQNLEFSEIERLMSKDFNLGIDVILDHLGGPYLNLYLNLIKKQGRIIFIDCLVGNNTQINLDDLITKRVEIIGSVLRSRNLNEKANIAMQIRNVGIPLMIEKAIKPKIDKIIPIEYASEGFQRLNERKNLGKICFKIGSF